MPQPQLHAEEKVLEANDRSSQGDISRTNKASNLSLQPQKSPQPEVTIFRSHATFSLTINECLKNYQISKNLLQKTITQRNAALEAKQAAEKAAQEAAKVNADKHASAIAKQQAKKNAEEMSEKVPKAINSPQIIEALKRAALAKLCSVYEQVLQERVYAFFEGNHCLYNAELLAYNSFLDLPEQMSTCFAINDNYSITLNKAITRYNFYKTKLAECEKQKLPNEVIENARLALFEALKTIREEGDNNVFFKQNAQAKYNAEVRYYNHNPQLFLLDSSHDLNEDDGAPVQSFSSGGAHNAGTLSHNSNLQLPLLLSPPALNQDEGAPLKQQPGPGASFQEHVEDLRHNRMDADQMHADELLRWRRVQRGCVFLGVVGGAVAGGLGGNAAGSAIAGAITSDVAKVAIGAKVGAAVCTVAGAAGGGALGNWAAHCISSPPHVDEPGTAGGLPAPNDGDEAKDAASSMPSMSA